MADQNEILNAAQKLGNMIGTHPAVSQYRELTRQLDLDVGARNLLGQFEQLMEALAMKEASMQPIEVHEKQQAQQLQQSIQLNPLLQKLMKAQMEYMDLMKAVQEKINVGLSGQEAPAAEGGNGQGASKIILE